MEKWFVEVPHSFKVEKKQRVTMYLRLCFQLLNGRWMPLIQWPEKRVDILVVAITRKRKTDYLASQAYLPFTTWEWWFPQCSWEKREQNWWTVLYTDVGLFIQLLALLCLFRVLGFIIIKTDFNYFLCVV